MTSLIVTTTFTHDLCMKTIAKGITGNDRLYNKTIVGY